MSENPEAPVAATPKADPQALMLRGRPARVIRFRRGVIVAIAALGSTAIAGVTWVALKPSTGKIVAEANEVRENASRGPGDALARAPGSYADVPKLGPPLPGDLGRPILRQEAALDGLPSPATGDQAAQALESERQRIAAERKAARESGVMLQLSGTARSAVSGTVTAATPAEPAPPQSPRGAIDPARDPGAQARKEEFVGLKSEGDVDSHRLVGPASPYILGAGSVIAASLLTGLNSDLPGLVTAHVTQNTYDSATGRVLLLPQGSRLIGRYDSVVATGQKRALVVWQRIITPDGHSIGLDNMPATDASGHAGLTDKVDQHAWQLLKGVVLSTLLGMGTELGFGDSESDLVRALRESAQQSGGRAGDQLVAKNLAIQPTLTVRPGWPLRVLVRKDLILAPYGQGGR